MPIIQGLEWTFDTVAGTYEKLRPGYVQELYRQVFDYLPADCGRRALEVGIGGGQATKPVLDAGFSVLAVEPGENFCRLLSEKYRDVPGFSVTQGKFEEIAFPDASFDLIYSASAFHWVPEEVGYSKVFRLLKSGGAFARFANHPYPDKENPELTEAIEVLYRKYYDAFHGKSKGAPREYSEADARNRVRIAEKYGFTDIRWALFHRTRSFTAEEYVQLLGTYPTTSPWMNPSETTFSPPSPMPYAIMAAPSPSTTPSTCSWPGSPDNKKEQQPCFLKPKPLPSRMDAPPSCVRPARPTPPPRWSGSGRRQGRRTSSSAPRKK